MNRSIRILAILLCVQLVLVFWLVWQQRAKSTGESNGSLINLPNSEIDTIVLKDEKSSLTLQQQDGAWILPNLFGFPASNQRVDEFLDQLLKIQLAWPVGTTNEAAKRFKVTDSNFERKITFQSKGKTLATLYLGTSPSFKKVHARTKSRDKTYAIPFSTYQAETKANHWLDDTYLHLNAKNIASVEMPAFTLTHTNDGFTLSDLSGDEQMAEASVHDFIDKLTHLGFREVIGKGELSPNKRGEEIFRYRITLKSGEKIDYVFSQPNDQTDYVLTPSSTDYAFKLTAYSVDVIRKIERAALISPVETSSAKSDKEAKASE